MTRLILPDTNLFFECQKLELLPWHELGEGPFVILLTKPVLDEIDKHKKMGNRTRRRAIEIFNRIRDLLRARAQEERLDISDVVVTLRLAASLTVGGAPPDGLDLGKNDDRLIAIVAELRTRGEDVFLLTHDTGPASTAEGLGLPFELIPDHWLRPPEETAEEKQLKALEGELADYRRSEPVLSLRVGEQSERTPTVRRIIARLTPLSDDDLDRAIAVLKEALPPKTDSNPPIGLPTQRAGAAFSSDRVRYEPPSVEDQRAYLEKTYPAWLEACRGVLASLHEIVIEKPITTLVDPIN